MSITQIGRYKITGTLGRGAMGVVYRAHDPLIERTLAIKTVDCSALSPTEAEDFEQRFFREAKSAGGLNHPNIVTIHDVGRSDNVPYIAMEFLVGRSVRDILDSGTVLSIARIVEIVAEIADGLAFAHANDVVHRDIKPANIMVLDNGMVKITDFGIALLPSGALTMVGTSLGTPKYMSPEQVLGHAADGRSDIFSLGAVLHEMLTGRAPFSGDNLDTILYQVLNITPPPPSSFNPELLDGFDRIVARAMAKEPDKRYANAAEMAVDLRSLGHSSVLTIDGGKGRISPVVDMKPGTEQTAGKIATDPPADQARAVVKTVSGRKYARHFGVALAALVLFGAWLLFRPTEQALVAQAGAPLGAQAVAPASAPPIAVDTVQKTTSAADEKKDEAAERQQSAQANRIAAKARAREARRVAAAEKTSPPRSDMWQVALRNELRVCDRASLFPRILCIDKARRTYCPGHWGSIEECSVKTNNN